MINSVLLLPMVKFEEFTSVHFQTALEKEIEASAGRDSSLSASVIRFLSSIIDCVESLKSSLYM